ncbi:hypothetical protein [Actinophytocola gossypii]|uniref:Uncharacterized protein n=1 Tax=Actinophytocola gossypii TaxID=2812003 RepID=A0ABT2JHP6_9PSEU|nr:hypothetical protein [Actinophytocola gossypii]MCT2587406.1 hypothetical protein [Actinophytocola gossypii]
MTGQDGFRGAAARFSAEVEAALTRARRAASEARAQSGEFRRDTAELAERARSGRPREPEPAPVPEPEDEDFSQHQIMVDAAPREEPEPDRTEPEPEPEPETAPTRDDEDFSRQRVLFDVTDEHYRPESLGTGIFELPEPENPR